MTWQVASVRDGVRQELKLCTWWRRWPRTGLDRDEMLTNKALADDHSISDSTWVAVQRARCELMDTWNRRSIVRAKKENWSLQHLESGRRCRCGLAWDTVQHRRSGRVPTPTPDEGPQAAARQREGRVQGGPASRWLDDDRAAPRRLGPTATHGRGAPQAGARPRYAAGR